MAKITSRNGKQRALRVLAIESSCDETGVALIEDGRVIRANVVASQASVHAQYGGVVPEVASRRQLEAIVPVLETAFADAGVGWEAVDAIAATYGPGLAGSLLVGLTAGKTLALARGLPFIGVNHLEAHIYANWLRTDEREQADPEFPLLALVVSGAHSELVYIAEHGHYELMGQTRDDAAGEAFDKVARLLGLVYPGGPAIQHAAAQRDTRQPNPYTLPRAWLPGTWDFSFSGLKTATGNLLAKASANGEEIAIADVAAAFQDAVVDALATKTVRAAEKRAVHEVLLAGGVAANLALRERLTADLNARDITLRYPPVAYCTDNAAMIGAAAYFHLRRGERDGYDLEVRPNLQLPFASARA
ncbi:MAG TPA: tRNA (adenosine(37)-N6)-threonylcarbamoyltransferase complex transferase subunit TsaD [Ktedonobacterales bacterium]|jgi:N6-L-threonylcarbamoyladenine synthase